MPSAASGLRKEMIIVMKAIFGEFIHLFGPWRRWLDKRCGDQMSLVVWCQTSMTESGEQLSDSNQYGMVRKKFQLGWHSGHEIFRSIFNSFQTLVHLNSVVIIQLELLVEMSNEIMINYQQTIIIFCELHTIASTRITGKFCLVSRAFNGAWYDLQKWIKSSHKTKRQIRNSFFFQKLIIFHISNHFFEFMVSCCDSNFPNPFQHTSQPSLNSGQMFVSCSFFSCSRPLPLLQIPFSAYRHHENVACINLGKSYHPIKYAEYKYNCHC